MHIRIVLGAMGGSPDPCCDPYAGAEGWSNPSGRHADEMAARQAWNDQFADERTDEFEYNARIRRAPGMIVQAGTSGVIPGFQG